MQWSASTSGASVPPKSPERVRLHTVAYHRLALRLPRVGASVPPTILFRGAGLRCRAAHGHRASTARGN